MRRLILAITTTIVLFLGGLGLQPASAEGYPPCTITGTSANETITGTEGNDVICTGGGNDTVNALGGNDIIIVSGPGIDTINGGSGNDTIEATLGTDSTIDAGSGDDIVYGTPGDDEITAGDGSDTVQGAGGADVINGGLAEDNLSGDAGNDTIAGEIGADTISGGDGNDTVQAGYGNDTVNGGAGDDNLSGEVGNDNLSGDAGNDTVNGGAGDDAIFGGVGNDQLAGEADIDIITGEAGDDAIDAGDGNDDVDAGDGNDTVTGGDGNDDINGDAGNDTITGDTGDDTVNGGDGEDTLNGTVGDDTLIGGQGNDTMKGGSGQDVLSGMAGDDKLDGGVDSDSITGGTGNNVCVRDEEDSVLECTILVQFVDDFVLFSGSLRDASGVGLAGVIVRISGSSGNYGAVTDQDGNFSTYLAKGFYSGIEIDSRRSAISGYPPRWHFLNWGKNIEITSNQTVSWVLPVTAKTVRVRVLDSQGNPAANASVSVCDSPTWVGTPNRISLGDFAQDMLVEQIMKVDEYGNPETYFQSNQNGDVYLNTFDAITFDVCISYWDENQNRVYREKRTIDLWHKEPGKPKSLLISRNSSNDWFMTWQAPEFDGNSTLINYLVEVSRDNGQSWQSVKNDFYTSNSLTVTGAAPGTTYLIRIAAVNAVGPSEYLTGSVTTLVVPASAPKNLVYTNLTESSVSLGWGLPESNGGSPITDYRVEVSSNGVNSWTVIPHSAFNSRGFNVSNLLPGRTYQFRIYAVTSVGVGEVSSILTLTTLGGIAPTSPEKLVVSAVKTNTASISWSGVVATQKVSNYLVDVSTDGNTWISVSKRVSTSTSLALSGLRLGTTYQVRVAAVNSVGTGSYVYRSFTTLATVSTAPTSLVSSNVSSSGFTLNWNAPASNGGAAITDYVVEINGGGFSWAPLSHEVTGDTSITVSGLNPGIKYTVRVKGVNRVGISKSSTSLYVTTLATTPGTVAGLTVKSVSATGAVITWTAPNTGGAKISDYLAEVSTDNGQTWKTVAKSASSSTTLTLKGLKTKTSYMIRVSAKNSVGYGAVTQGLALTTP